MNDNVAGSSNALEADLYSIYDDLDGNPVFDIKLMRNLERLEKYMTWEQIMEIRPGYTFKLILKDNYLANIESLPRIESALDTWIFNWLKTE